MIDDRSLHKVVILLSNVLLIPDAWNTEVMFHKLAPIMHAILTRYAIS